MWLALGREPVELPLTTYGREVIEVLERRGATFFHEITTESGLLATQVEQALGELVALGQVTADSFAGLRALLTPSSKRKPFSTSARRRHRTAAYGVETAGRWSLLRDASQEKAELTPSSEERALAVEAQARALLGRYGIVFRRLVSREPNLARWRDLVMVYRRLEARGEIRGGRFVSGMSGEQFALPEAVGQLRSIRRSQRSGLLIGISAADPLNLTGIITPGERIPRLTSNRVVYRDGVPIAAMEAGKIIQLSDYKPATQRDVERALVRRRVSPALRGYLGKVG